MRVCVWTEKDCRKLFIVVWNPFLIQVLRQSDTHFQSILRTSKYNTVNSIPDIFFIFRMIRDKKNDSCSQIDSSNKSSRDVWFSFTTKKKERKKLERMRNVGRNETGRK